MFQIRARPLAWLACCVVVTLTACGGGTDQTGKAAAPLSASQHVRAAPHGKAIRNDLVTGFKVQTEMTGATAREEALLNWAERHYPQYFPGHGETLAYGPWRFRSYEQTGVKIGLDGESVFVLGSGWGPEPLYVGQISDFIHSPYAVLPTSYQNKNRPELRSTVIPQAGNLGLERYPTYGYLQLFSLVWADFTQDGQFTVMAFQTRFSGEQQWSIGAADLPNKVVLLEKSGTTFIDITERLIPDVPDREVCITPASPIVADFNSDGKPDVFLPCAGPDFPVNGVYNANTQQVAFLSQPDGTYKKWTSTFLATGAHCSAGDINGDGNADVVCTDPGKSPYTLLGDGKGNFTRDDGRFPDLTNKASMGIELIDTGSGLLDVFIGGVPPNGDTWEPGWSNNIWIKNDGHGRFNVNSPIVLPTSVVTRLAARQVNYSEFHDVVVYQGFIYLLQYDYEYVSTVVRKISLADVTQQSVVFERVEQFPGGSGLAQFRIDSTGYLLPITTCGPNLDDPLYKESACAWSMKL